MPAVDAPAAPDATALTPPGPGAAQLERLRDDVRAAAQQDAAEIVSRARQEIRRVVTDARRELLELSAQLQAVNVSLPDAALPDPSVIADEELPGPLPGLTGGAVPRWLDEPRETMTATAAGADTPRAEAQGLREPVSSFLLHADAEAAAAPPPTRRWIPIVALAAVIVVVAIAWTARRGVSPSSVKTVANTAPAAGTATPEPAAPSTTDAPAAEAPVAAPDHLSLELSWRRPTWVRTTIDGTADAGRVYDEGTTRHVDAADAVTLRAGDAGALMVSLNGAPPVPLGPDGTTMTRQFSRPVPTPPASAAAPAPSATPTTAPAAQAAGRTGGPAGTTASAPTGAGSATPSASPSASPSAAAPAAPTDAAPPVRPTPPGRVDLTISGPQWLDAYHRQDRGTMETVGGPGAIVSDDRRPDQRFPFGLEVTRRMDEVGLNLSGDTAVYTGRMVERAATGEHTSRVTQTWVRRMGVWRLQESRITADTAPPRP